MHNWSAEIVTAVEAESLNGSTHRMRSGALKMNGCKYGRGRQIPFLNKIWEYGGIPPKKILPRFYHNHTPFERHVMASRLCYN